MREQAGWERWYAGRAWATNAMLCLQGVGLMLLARQFTLESDNFTIGFSGVSGWSVTLYLASILVVLTQPTDRWTYGIIVGFAIACRAMTVFEDPFMSSDIFRYVWDGVVQHAHVNPYRYVPGDEALKFLREPNQDIYDGINRRDYARTIYPPGAQLLFWLITFFSPTVDGMKAAMVGFEVVTAGALLAILRRLGRPRTDLLLYAWMPLLVWEIAGAGHLDAAVFAFVTLAFLFRIREQPWLTGLCLGMAIATKFYPFVLFPALYRRGDWKMPTAAVAVVAGGYAIYSSVGKLVLGFLGGGYQREEGIDSGARFFLLEYAHQFRLLHSVPVSAYLALCALVLLAIAAWAWCYAGTEAFAPTTPRPAGSAVLRTEFPRPKVIRAGGMLGFAMMLLFSPHYPWYIAWLVPLFVMDPNLPLLTYLCAFFYGFTTWLADPGPKMFLLNKRLYGVVLLAMAVHLLLWRWPLLGLRRGAEQRALRVESGLEGEVA